MHVECTLVPRNLGWKQILELASLTASIATLMHLIGLRRTRARLSIKEKTQINTQYDLKRGKRVIQHHAYICIPHAHAHTHTHSHTHPLLPLQHNKEKDSTPPPNSLTQVNPKGLGRVLRIFAQLDLEYKRRGKKKETKKRDKAKKERATMVKNVCVCVCVCDRRNE